MRVKRLLCAGIACCLAIGIAAVASPTTAVAKDSYAEVTEAPDYSYKLKEVDSFSGEESDIRFLYGGAIKTEGSSSYLLGLDGEKLIDEEITGLDYLGSGVYAVNVDNGDEINNCGLVSVDGEQLLDFEAAVIKTVTDDPDDARFAKVVYATEKTDDKDECFVYSTDKTVSINPEDGDTMYKGYAEVFDLKKGKIVKGVRITESTFDVLTDLGDSFMVSQSDGSKIMYDASGKEIWKSGGSYATASAHVALDIKDNGASLVDSKGKTHYETENSIRAIPGRNDYFAERTDDGEYTVVDIDGNQVLKGSYDYVNYEAGGLFDVDQDDDERVVDGNGKTVLEHSGGELTEIVPGYCSSYNKDDTVLIKDGEEILKGESSDIQHIALKNDDDEYFVVADDDYVLKLEYPVFIDTALVNGKKSSSSNKFNLYDLFTGEALLDKEYERIDVAGGYIYVFDDGTWTTYEVILDD